MFAGCEVHVRAILQIAVRLHSGFEILHEIDLKVRDLVGSVGILLLFIREAAREF